MKSDISQFQRHCEKAIGQLSSESLEEFKGAKDDVSRIQVMYPLARQIPLDAADGCSKNFQEAEQLKNAGNLAFSRKDYLGAIQSYNQAIICCPQHAGTFRNSNKSPSDAPSLSSRRQTTPDYPCVQPQRLQL